MGKTYRDEAGRPHPHPVGYEAAIKARSKRFIPLAPCVVCGKQLSYTKNKGCVYCSRIDASDLYNFVIGQMTFMDYPEGFPLEAMTLYREQRGFNPGLDRDVSAEYRDEVFRLADLLGSPAPRSPEDAVDAESNLWISPDPCGVCGRPGLRYVDGECYFCQEEKVKRHKVSPRQAAIEAGEAWYTPDTLCPKCHTLAKRNVNNGRCLGCKPPPAPATQTPEQLMMEAQPDLILSKKDAKALGMKVYRTGKPCKDGHTGYRYTSTGNCIECHKARS